MSILKEVQARLSNKIDEALRLVSTHHSEDGKHSAKVYRDNEWGEHRVKYFSGGKHHTEADSHHDDLDDAEGTAKHHLDHMQKTHKEEYTSEDFEQLDEISKQKIDNYIHAASHDIYKRGPSAKTTKRATSMNKAADKFVKEEEQLDELSKDTLNSYRQKSDIDVERREKLYDKAKIQKTRDKHGRKIENRVNGWRTATYKLNKEEVEQIDELSKNTKPLSVILAEAKKITNP